MKQTLLLICSLFLFSGLQAQNLEFDVDPVVVSFTINETDGVGHSIITNTANEARNLRWDRTVIEMTDGWGVAVCDKNQCYLPTVTGHAFDLDANEGGTMDVHVYPNGIEGSAIIEVTITDTNDENLSISNLYYFNQQPSGTIDLNRQSVKVYPNPSNGLFTVKGNKQITSLEVFSLTGVQVQSFTYNDGKWYDISDLPKGTYIVRLLDRDAQQLVTKLINKF